MRETAGLTYAEYARSGFAQLVIVALLTLAVVAASLRWARLDGHRTERLLRLLLMALCLLTIVVLASALHRLGLYERAFGFTRTRMAAHALLLFGGALPILVAGALAADRDPCPRGRGRPASSRSASSAGSPVSARASMPTCSLVAI